MDAWAERRVPIGRVSGVYGVQGWLKVRSATEPPSRILEYRPWQVGRGGGWQSFAVRCGRAHGAGFIALLAGIDDRESARRLVGANIAVHRAQLPATAPDEYYWCDLVGLAVEEAGGSRLGRVARLMETGANDVIVVEGAGEEVLIPFVPGRTVRAVDLEAERIVVDWPPHEEGAR